MTSLDPAVDADVRGADDTEIEGGFSKSIFVSAVRCLLTYIVFPFVTPLVSVMADIGPWIGVFLGTFAIFANVFSIRRFWVADHKWKKPVTVIHVGIIILLTVLVINDFREIFF